MLRSHFLLVLGWAVYFIIHSAMAQNFVKNRVRKLWSNKFKFYRLLYSLLAMLLLVPLLYWQILLPSLHLWQPGLAGNLVGGLFIGSGLAGMVICLKKYLFSSEGFKDLFFEGAKPALQIQGLHRLVRHPLYLSTFIFLGGIFLIWPTLSNLLVYVLMVVYVVVAIPMEEEKLVELYGDQYLRYRAEVPALLPGLKTWNKAGRKK